eukprot:GHRR01019474.1.p1 GENE.GHRR01019474.1~~GHRR01019474.1.p1  ORF type:complete len:462 (+),score=186.66 GHRR01019474.1:276-1661(+)
MTVPEGLEPSAIQMPVHQRPQLVPGVSLSPIILSCSLSSDPKAMLAESWTAKTADEAQADCATASPVFNPAAPEYNELAQRVSQSSAMQRWNEAMVRVKHAEKQLKAGGLKGAEKEARQGELDEAQQQLGEAQAALNDVTSSFEADPLSLVPWMSALFALADAGCSCFDAGGGGWPPPNAGQVPLTELLGPPSSSTRGPAAASAWLYGGSEKVLGVFKRRYESERGPGRLSIFTRLAINCFGSDSPADLAAAVEKAVERSRAAIFGPEAAVAGAPLDLVQLHWLDYHEHDFIPVLLKLHCLANDRYEPSPDGTGEMVVTQPRGVAALGLVEPPAHAVTTALRAGVHLACVTVSYSLLNVSAAPVIQLCHSRGIKVFAVGALAYGLMSEAFLGAPAPNPAAAAAGGVAGPTTDSPAGGAAAVGPCEALGPDNLAAGLDMVARWACQRYVVFRHALLLVIGSC